MYSRRHSTFAVRRMREQVLNILKTALIAWVALMPVFLHAYATDPPLAHTGAPGEITCVECHTGPAAVGPVVIFPSTTYTPGGPAVNWTVNSPGGSGGFELSVRPDPADTAQAGTLSAGSATSDIGILAGIQYARHFARAASWVIAWTPPATNIGNVTVFVASVDSGGKVYATKYPLTPAVTAPGAITASPSTLSFNYSGTALATQSFQVTSGGASLAFTTGVTTLSGGSWLSATAGGSTPLGVTVTANPTGLANGAYTGTVTVTAPAANNSPQTVAVTLNVTSAAPPPPPVITLSATPNSLSFSSSAAQSQTLHLAASDGSRQAFTASAATATGSSGSSGCSWLSVSPASGTTPATAKISVNSSSLPNGTYTGEVIFTSTAVSISPVLVGVTLVVAATPGRSGNQGACGQWTTPAGTITGTRFSSLSQITSDNVGRITEEFRFATGVLAGHQGAPLVVGNTMYVVGPFPNKLFALDLTRPGQTRWVFDPMADEYAMGQACCDISNRGAVFADGKIIYNTLDNTTVAVDAATGTQVWRTSMGDVHTGQTMVMAPIVVRDKVFVGNSGAELGLRGWVAALDLKTGVEVWRAWSTGPDADVKIGSRFKPFYKKDQGTNLGVSTWPGTLWQQGGGTVWAWLTYDAELNLLFEGTSNPGTWNHEIRPGDNKWGSTIFARDPDTGEAIWAYQMTPHDAWDYDTVNENIVVDLPFNGTMRKLLVHFNKNGFAYTMDRASGQLLVANPFVSENWADHIDLTTGLPAVNSAKIPHTGVITTDICPAPPGGKDMEPAAFSPLTGLFYIPSINICIGNELIEVKFLEGTPFIGANAIMKAGPGGNRGALIAWDAVNGRKVWSITENFPLYSGVLATAGNLLFYGTMDRWFKAVDATTGKVLFQTQLPSGIIGNPITFMGPDGKQRIAIYAGVGGYVGAIVPAGLALDDPYAAFGIVGATKDLPQFTPPGGTVHVFKLP